MYFVFFFSSAVICTALSHWLVICGLLFFLHVHTPLLALWVVVADCLVIRIRSFVPRIMVYCDAKRVRLGLKVVNGSV